MKQELFDTAVRFETPEEAKAIVELYKLAGFKGHRGFSSFSPSDYCFVGINPKGDICYIPKLNTDLYREITLDQLAWDYGLGPDGAWQLYLSPNKQLFWHKHPGEISVAQTVLISTKPAEPEKPVYTWEMYDNGELPPVGSELKSHVSGITFECTAHSGNRAILVTSRSKLLWFKRKYHGPTTPRKTAKELAIEKAFEVTGNNYTVTYEKLYDVGMLKLPEGE